MLGTLRDAGAHARHLCIEVSEAVLMRARDEALDAFTRLRDAGVLLALDDFGTGYASLSNVGRAWVDVLKIDRLLTAQLGSEQGVAVVDAVTRLCAQLGVDVVAEGVETEAQLDALRRLGCPSAQGTLFGPALRPEVATRLLVGSATGGDGGRPVG